MAYKVLKTIPCIKGAIIPVVHKGRDLYIDMIDPITGGIYLTETTETEFSGVDIPANIEDLKIGIEYKKRVQSLADCLRANGYGSISAILEQIKYF